MKNNSGSGNKQQINRSSDKKGITGAANRKRPEIRDNLDHRETIEQDKKGGDVTHNRKNDMHKPNKQK